MIVSILKYIFIFLITYLLGSQTIYSKTKLALPQNQVSFSIEKTKSFNSLEKEVQPNLGFLKEKSKFGNSESISTQNQHVFSEKDVSNLANTGSKFKIITKLDGLGDLTHAKRFVNSLDETVDAALLNKLDELDGAPLRNLDDFYADLGRNTPSPYTNTDINFIATKSITVKGKKYVNGQVTDVSKTINVDLPYKHGFPEFHKTDYCPEITLANGSKGKYKYVDDNLDFSKYGDHFKDANRRLLDDMRLTNSTKNAEGFYQTGNYRWNGKTSDFELKNANDVWEKYTWHHYQDGKTMIPVLSHVHSTGLKGFKHAGGQSLSTKGILGIFEFLGF